LANLRKSLFDVAIPAVNRAKAGEGVGTVGKRLDDALKARFRGL
jgi:hypothetical protein